MIQCRMLDEAARVRVLIADPAVVIRAGLRTVLGYASGIEVVAEVSDGLAAIDTARRLRPDVILTEVRLTGVDGLELTRLLSAGPPPGGIPVILVTSLPPDELAVEALRAGACGIVAKDGPAEHLVAAVRVAAMGGIFLTRPSLLHLIERRRPPEPTGEPALAALTAREVAVLRLIAEGLSNAEIATRLHIAPATVKTHVQHVFEKLRLRNRSEAVAFVHRAGLG